MHMRFIEDGPLIAQVIPYLYNYNNIILLLIHLHYCDCRSKSEGCNLPSIYKLSSDKQLRLVENVSMKWQLSLKWK